MVQQITDNFWQAEARSEETKQFIRTVITACVVWTIQVSAARLELAVSSQTRVRELSTLAHHSVQKVKLYPSAETVTLFNPSLVPLPSYGVCTLYTLHNSALKAQPPVIGSHDSGSSSVSTFAFDCHNPCNHGSWAGCSGNHQ